MHYSLRITAPITLILLLPLCLRPSAHCWKKGLQRSAVMAKSKAPGAGERCRSLIAARGLSHYYPTDFTRHQTGERGQLARAAIAFDVGHFSQQPRGGGLSDARDRVEQLVLLLQARMLVDVS